MRKNRLISLVLFPRSLFYFNVPSSPQRQVVPKENVKIIKQEIAFLVSVTGVMCEGVRVMVYDVTCV